MMEWGANGESPWVRRLIPIEIGYIDQIAMALWYLL